MLIVQMDWFALNLALPAIARHFNVAPTDLQWVVSGYMLSIGALMVTAGRLADIFGRRLVIVIGLAIFGVVSIVCGRAGRWCLIVARVVHGIGAALDLPGVDRGRVEHVRGAAGARDRHRARRRRDRPGAAARSSARAFRRVDDVSGAALFFITILHRRRGDRAVMLRYVKEDARRERRPGT